MSDAALLHQLPEPLTRTFDMATIGVPGRASAPIAVQVTEALEGSLDSDGPASNRWAYRLTMAVAGAHSVELHEYPHDLRYPADCLDDGVPMCCELVLCGPSPAPSTAGALQARPDRIIDALTEIHAAIGALLAHAAARPRFDAASEDPFYPARAAERGAA